MSPKNRNLFPPDHHNPFILLRQESGKGLLYENNQCWDIRDFCPGHGWPSRRFGRRCRDNRCRHVTGPSAGSLSGAQTDSIHKLGTITYYLNGLGGVTKHTLDASNTITMYVGNILVLEVPALVSGPANQKGQVLLYWPGPDAVSHSLLLKPDKWGRLRTQDPPLRWNAPASNIPITLMVVAPDGKYSVRGITINVL